MKSAPAKKRNGLRIVSDWMKQTGKTPFPFQRKVWREILAGNDGLLHSPTGSGKTLAIWLGALAAWFDQIDDDVIDADRRPTPRKRRIKRHATVPIRVVWLTPLRALTADTLQALKEPVDSLHLPWSVERRTSDTSSTLKQSQIRRLPSCLITTPESLSVLLSQSRSHVQFRGLHLIVLDEWHELMGTKRGVQAELCLARLRMLSPDVRTWAISATIGNDEDAMKTAVGHGSLNERRPALVRAPARRRISMRSLIPKPLGRFPWAGHMGLKSVGSVVEAIEAVGSSLVFTNTRSQAERWYSAILEAKPEWAGQIGVHHGSLDRKQRRWVEQALDSGKLRCVVCTSSLDLGVDFFPVEQVLQVGSPKGIARLLQRAGRSGHYPGGKSQLVFVPTHALELIELAAAKDALKANRIESRVPLTGCLDVLAQHVVTVAAGNGFEENKLFDEVRRTCAFAELTRTQWRWVLDFVQRGGASLVAYPDFTRVINGKDNQWQVHDAQIARRHRMSIGTIPSDSEMLVRYMRGTRLGTIEERFISKLKPGEKFMFAGRVLKLEMVRDMTAWVRRAKGSVAALPRWHGGRMPLSSELSEAVREKLGEASRGQFVGPEMRSVKKLLALQSKWSVIPDEESLLIEQIKTRDGYHLFIYPFEGRLVHEGLAALLAWRISRIRPISFASTVNDYGIELLSPTEPPLEAAIQRGLFDANHLENHIEKCMNAAELDRRQFRDIARVAGLIHGGFPGHSKSTRQLQASSDLFFDVFREYDPQNLLLKQARREVLEFQLEHWRLETALRRMSSSRLQLQSPPKPTPLAFPLLVDRIRMKLSSEKLAERIARLTQQYEASANKE